MNIHKCTPILTLERQLWPQPPMTATPYWCYINTLMFKDISGKTVWEQQIPEADFGSPFRGSCKVIIRKNFGWILVASATHETAKKMINRFRIKGLTYHIRK